MCSRSQVIGPYERGLVFLDGSFQDVLRPGPHWILDPCARVRVDVVSVREVWVKHPQLDAIVQSGALSAESEVVRLEGHERAVVWVDDHVETVLTPGLYALWTVLHAVHVDVVDARVVRFDPEVSSTVDGREEVADS